MTEVLHLGEEVLYLEDEDASLIISFVIGASGSQDYDSSGWESQAPLVVADTRPPSRSGQNVQRSIISIIPKVAILPSTDSILAQSIAVTAANLKKVDRKGTCISVNPKIHFFCRPTFCNSKLSSAIAE